MTGTVDRPWYIGLLLGVAGWFAGLFLLVFVFAIFRPNSATSALAMGAVLLAAAWGLYRIDREGAFVSQLALAFSIAGQVAMLFGLHESFFKGFHDLTSFCIVALVMQLALTAVMPNNLHRTMTTLFACIAWALVVRFMIWDEPKLFSNRAAAPPPSLPMTIAGWFVAWVPVGAALYFAVSKWRAVATGLILGLAFATLVSYPLDAFRFFEGFETRRAGMALWPLLSALAALGAMAAAFAIHSRGLLGLCVVAGLLHVSHFYYQMDTSLLMKSVIMLVLGGVLLGASRVVRQRR